MTEVPPQPVVDISAPQAVPAPTAPWHADEPAAVAAPPATAPVAPAPVPVAAPAPVQQQIVDPPGQVSVPVPAEPATPPAPVAAPVPPATVPVAQAAPVPPPAAPVAPQPIPIAAPVPAAPPAPAAPIQEVVQPPAPVAAPAPVASQEVAIVAPAPVAVPPSRPVMQMEGFSPEEMAEMASLAGEAVDVVDSSDLRMSQFAIVQSTSKAVTELGIMPGTIIHTLTGEQFPNGLEFVVSFIKKTRTRFKAKAIGEAPLCSSPNALDGYGDPATQLVAAGAIGPNGGGDCSRCPAAVVDFKNKKIGDCALQWNFIGFRTGEGADPATEMPLVVQMQRTSIQTAQNLSTLLASLRFPWGARIKVTAKARTNDNGTFFVWAIAKGAATDAVEIRKALDIARMVKHAQSVTVEQSDVADGIIDVTPGDGSYAAPVAAGGSSVLDDDDIPF